MFVGQGLLYINDNRWTSNLMSRYDNGWSQGEFIAEFDEDTLTIKAYPECDFKVPETFDFSTSEMLIELHNSLLEDDSNDNVDEKSSKKWPIVIGAFLVSTVAYFVF